MKITHLLIAILIFALVIGLIGCKAKVAEEEPVTEDVVTADETVEAEETEPLIDTNISDTGVDIDDTDADVSDLEDVLGEI